MSSLLQYKWFLIVPKVPVIFCSQEWFGVLLQHKSVGLFTNFVSTARWKCQAWLLGTVKAHLSSISCMIWGRSKVWKVFMIAFVWLLFSLYSEVPYNPPWSKTRVTVAREKTSWDEEEHLRRSRLRCGSLPSDIFNPHVFFFSLKMLVNVITLE